MLQTVGLFGVALLVAIVFILLIRSAGRGEGPHWAVVLVIVVAAGGSAWFADARLRRMEVERRTSEILAAIDRNPFASAMRESDPASYDRLRRVVEDTEVFPDDQRLEKAKALSAPIIMEVVSAHVHHMNDDMLVETMGVANDIRKFMMRSNPQACDLAPSMGMGDMQGNGDVMVRALGMVRARTYVIDLLRSPPAPPRAAPPEEDGRLALMSLAPTVAQRENVSMEDLAADMRMPAYRCRIGSDFIDALLALPKEQAAPIIRSLSHGQLG